MFSVSSRSDEEIFRRGLLQSATIFFVLVCGACAVIISHLLSPFLSSILWSLFLGALLFPLKTRCTSLGRCYLQKLDKDSHLLVFGLIILLPMRILDRSIDLIGVFWSRKWKEFLFILICLPTVEFFQSGMIYRSINTLIYKCYIHLERHVRFGDSPWMLTMIGLYFFAVLTVYNSSDRSRVFLTKLAGPMWCGLVLYLSQILPINYRVIVLICTGVLAVFGYGFSQNINKCDRSKVEEDENAIHRLGHFRKYFLNKSALSSNGSSTRYFTFILWSLLAIKIHEFSWYFIPISIFIILYKMIKFLLLSFRTYLTSQKSFLCLGERMKHFWTVRDRILIPIPVKFSIRCLRKGDKRMNYALQNSMDYLVSASLIVILFVLVVFGSLFLLIQIQHESTEMIKLTSALVNQTNVLQQVLPAHDHIWKFAEDAFEKSYVFGRRWIILQVAKVQPPRREPHCCLPLSIHPSDSPYMHIPTLNQNSLSNKRLEEHALQLWENLYTYLSNSSSLFLPARNRSRMFDSTLNENIFTVHFLKQLQRSYNFRLSDLYHLTRENLDLLQTVFDSIWSNTTLVLTILSTIISLIFTGGFAILNFVFSFIVFITLLFYFLSYSNSSVYRPTEWLNRIFTIGDSRLGKAVNDVVTSVFMASLKMATFYGLYTYIWHTLLGSHLVFIPAVIASLCAMTLKSFWAALLGCLDLWLIQQRPISALILLIAQIIPIYIVDTAIYSEVKGGGHQYLTALAIAGGVYYRGIEGALIGPIILCCFLVGIRMYNEMLTMKTVSSDIGRRFSRSISLQPNIH